MLSLQYFRPCSDKVFKTEFHPTQPWVVSATKSDFVSIWDWNSQQVLHKVQLGEVGEGELYGDVDLGRLHLKDESVTVNLSLTGPTTSRSATGKVRDVRFLDADVVAAQVASAHALAQGTAMPTPSVAPVAAAMHGQRLVVIVCEQKVLVCDVVSRQVRELQSKTSLEGKSATCCAFLYLSGFQAAGSRGAVVLPSPVLAVGCSDGLVRLFQLSTLHFLAVLTAPHKSAVTSLTVAHVKGAVHEALVATFASGNMSTWEPFVKPIGTGRGIVIQHSGDHKMHDKEVVGAVVVAVDEAPGETRSLLVTAGIDTRCVLSECPSLKEVHRHKLESKAPPCCLAYVPRGYTTANTHCLLMGTDVGVVVAVHPTLGSLRVVCNLNGQIPGGTKKMPKIYSIAVHPLQPQLVLLGTNTGMALTCLDVQITPPAAPLPLTTPGQVLDNNHEGVTFVSAVGDAVYCTTATTSQEKVRAAQVIAAAAAAAAAPPPAQGAKGKDSKDVKDANDPKDPKDPTDAKDVKDVKPSAASLLDLLDEPVAPLPSAIRVSGGSGAPAPSGGAYQADGNRAPVVQVLNNSKIASGRPMSRAVLAASHDGEYMSVTWPVARQYAVYRRNAANWTEICAGVGTSVAWHACEARFAVVESPGAAPPPPTATPVKGKGGVFKSGKPSAKEQERARIEYAAAQAAALVAANTPPVVQVRACSSVGVSVVHRGLVLSPQDVAVAVTSGPMLAVTLKRQLNNSASLYPGGEPPCAMQLYDWGKGHRVGVELPAPLVMTWDPSLTLVALAYTSQVLLCSAQPNLQPVASLPISNATGIQWGLRQVYIATATAIYAAFVTLPNTEEQHPAPITVHTLTFACFGAPIPDLAPAIADGDPAAAGGLPPPLPRPAGPLTLLGPRDGYLWVLNVHGQAIALPLARHAGVRAMCMAASGDGQGAVQVANASLAPEHHGMIGALLCTTAGTRGAGMALHLTGLGLVDDALLRLKLHQWPQAMEAVEALLVGFTHRPAQGVFSYPMSTAAFNVESHSFMGGGMDMSGFAPTAPATGRAYVDDLDWLAPVRSAATNQATLSALSVASSAPPPASAATSPQAAALAMTLLKELKGVRMQDACKYLVQMLLTYAPTLSGAQLSELILVMAELGMRQELPQVVHMLAPGCRGGSWEALGLLSALLTGHGPLVADVLGGQGGTSGGNAALAAARAASVAKDPTSKMVAVMDWQHMLEHMVTDQAPAGSGPGVHFKPLAVDA